MSRTSSSSVLELSRSESTSVSASVFLPPANEVWEGFVFTGVCLSTRGACVPSGTCMAGGACVVGVCAWQGGHVWCGHAWQGHAWPGCVCGRQGAGETTTAAGGTHSTGMHFGLTYMLINWRIKGQAFLRFPKLISLNSAIQ